MPIREGLRVAFYGVPRLHHYWLQGEFANLFEATLPVDPQKQLTSFRLETGKVEFLGGLVKTLHPAIHAGILAGRANQDHMAELASAGWRKIDMVVVNFYPLGSEQQGRDLSFIDIGGPSMARAAAKNFRSCIPVPHPSWSRSRPR